MPKYTVTLREDTASRLATAYYDGTDDIACSVLRDRKGRDRGDGTEVSRDITASTPYQACVAMLDDKNGGAA